MKISAKDWNNYVNRLRQLSDTAAMQMQQYIQTNGIADTAALIDYAYGLATKYGEGSAELACQMYDAIATLQGASVLPAVPADTATFDETAKAINGSLIQSETGQMLEGVIDRLVKLSAEDTMLQNAVRDGAYFAWVPMGQTCPYCLMMGGIGWQRAGKKTLYGTHARHVHAHCDCQYIVDMKGGMQVSGYDPDKIQDTLLDALPEYQKRDIWGYSFDDLLRDNGRTWMGTGGEGINELRRIDYAKNKTKINEQKRKSYAIRTGTEEI